jgi:formamidopyrimidine-DNA glycosylase
VPEGHTIHRAARAHQRLLGGQVLAASSPQGRFAEAAARLDGRRLVRVEAWGKHLFYEWDGGLVLHVHLGLFGRFTTHPAGPPPAPVGAVRLRLCGARGAVDLAGPTACELGDLSDRERIVARLGPDPLRADADGSRFVERVLASRSAIGKLLMDQTVVAGVGNVYRAEALFLTGLHPEHPGRSQDRPAAERLWRLLGVLLGDGLRRGRILTVHLDGYPPPAGPTATGEPALPRRPALPGRPTTPGARARPGDNTWVYRRASCRRCGSPVRRWDLAGRWCYACENCQPPP